MKEPWDNELGWYVKFADGETRLVTTERCWNCKEWLSLGESNDEPECVRVEIRAAELSKYTRGTYCSNDAWSGWRAHLCGWEPAPTTEAEAGWLAREIHEHKEQP